MNPLKNLYSKLVILAFFAGITVFCGAQRPVFSFDKFGIKEGLSSLKVFSVAQDNQGFIWIGTADGLDRFDGYQFKIYRNIPDDSTSIPVSRIVEMKVDREGMLWLATKNEGLIRFDTELGRFKHFLHSPDDSASLPFNDIWDFYLDDNNTLWCTYDMYTGFYITKDLKFVTDSMPPAYMNEVRQRLFFQDLFKRKLNKEIGEKLFRLERLESGDYLVGLVYGGLYCYSPVSGELREIKENGFEKVTSITNLFKDKAGNIWVTKSDGGVFKYNPLKKNFRNYSALNSRGVDFDNMYVRTMALDHLHNLWVGTNKNGVIKINSAANNFVHYVNKPSDPNSLPGNEIRSIYIDNENKLWVGGRGFISQLDKSTGKFKNYKLRDELGGQYHARTFDITEDNYGNLWLANWDNLVRFNKDKGTFRYYSKDRFSMDNIRHILIDNLGYLWISAEYGGIVVFDPDKDKVVRRYNDTTGLSNSGVFQVHQETEHIFWAATFNGLDKIDIRDGQVKVYTSASGLTSNVVLGIIEDAWHNFWLPTANGLVWFNRENNSFRSFKVSDGLEQNEFVEGARYFNKYTGEVYVGGVKGINFFHPDAITVDTNVPNVAITSFKLYNQEVRPGEVQDGRVILDRPIEYTDEIELHYLKDKVFTFEFAALHYNGPGRNKYAYKMEGFDDDYIYTTASARYATYTNLNPGTYYFRVKASNNHGIWNEEGKTVRLVIVPAFWQTPLFQFLVLVFIISVSAGFYFMRIRKIKKQQKVLENRVEERTMKLQDLNAELEEKKEEIETQKELLLGQNEELGMHKNNLELLVKERTRELEAAKEKAEESDRLKTSFLNNMSHEIRTPMNAILGFTSLLIDEMDPEEKGRYIKIIHKNGGLLLSIFNDIIDLSKIQSGATRLAKANFSFKELLEELYQTYCMNEELVKNKDIEFRYKPVKDDIVVYSDYSRCKQIINYLLSNAFKYTMGGFVELSYTITGYNTLNIMVKDTGIGISKENLELIFDRFSKIEEREDKLFQGAGLGLSVSKKLAHLLGGDISVESVLGKGSEFILTLPNCVKEEETAHRQPAADIKDFIWNGKHLLIAEDEDDNYFFIDRLLKNTRLNIIRVKNGLEAVKCCAENENINLVLMDIKMPLMNGYDALKEIRGLRKELPVIAQTAYAQDNDIKKMKAAGFTDIITKPITNNLLLSMISDYLE